MSYHENLKYNSPCLFFLLVLIVGCEKSEPEPDPCLGVEKFEADFSILEHVGDSLVNTDNVLHYSGVTFAASGDYDTYEWQVGNDQNVSTKRNYFLLFTEVVQDIQVRLIAKKAATPCFPNDDGVDTVFRTFSVVPWKEAAILGRYVGSYTRTPDLVDTVQISYSATAESPEPFGEFKMVNVNRGCDADKYPHTACPRWSRGYRAFTVHTPICKKCPGTYGIVQLVAPDTIEAVISYGDTTSWESSPLPQIDDKFVGSRISP